VLTKFQSFFYELSETLETSRQEKERLSDECKLLKQQLSEDCNSIKQQLVIAKLALADKDIQLFEISTRIKQAPDASAQQASAPVPRPVKKTPNVTHKPVDDRPTLVARLRKGVTKNQASEDRIDALLGIHTGGPVVQHFKKSEDKVTLTFRDITARDKARELINVDGQQSPGSIFQSAFVPQKVYPAIARLYDLAAIQGIKETNIQDEQLKKRVAIMKLIQKENPLLTAH
jgi:hypothetical protein